MINSTEARKLSKNFIINKYDKIIREAAEQGNFYVTVNYFLDSNTREVLEEFGHQVEESDEGGYTKISW